MKKNIKYKAIMIYEKPPYKFLFFVQVLLLIILTNIPKLVSKNKVVNNLISIVIKAINCY
jgi:hypothetical protein